MTRRSKYAHNSRPAACRAVRGAGPAALYAGEGHPLLCQAAPGAAGRAGADGGAQRAAEELLASINALLRLRQDDAAEHRRQERAIRQQISNISHDLRTPLTSILGYLQLLEGDSLTQEERGEYLEIVRGRAKSLQSLITSFYELSRLEGGEYPLSREKVDLYHILSELAAEFYNDFEEARV